MAQSRRSLMRSGLISPKASAKLAVLKKTRAQKSKMATFDHTFRDEGRTQQRAEVPNREIDHPTNQRDRARSLPSKGGSVGRIGMPKTAHIDREQGPKFPAGGSVRAGKKTVGVRGGVQQAGPIYGGGSRGQQ